MVNNHVTSGIICGPPPVFCQVLLHLLRQCTWCLVPSVVKLFFINSPLCCFLYFLDGELNWTPWPLCYVVFVCSRKRSNTFIWLCNPAVYKGKRFPSYIEFTSCHSWTDISDACTASVLCSTPQAQIHYSYISVQYKMSLYWFCHHIPYIVYKDSRAHIAVNWATRGVKVWDRTIRVRKLEVNPSLLAEKETLVPKCQQATKRKVCQQEHDKMSKPDRARCLVLSGSLLMSESWWLMRHLK